jgi:hypothetical protein
MRLIIIWLCLCSGVSLVSFSRVGFPEDPLHILGSPRPAADREAKDQARFARLQPPAAVQTTGRPVTQDDVTRTAPVEEPVRVEALVPEGPTAAAPSAATAPINEAEPARKTEPAREHHSATQRTSVRPVRMTSVPMKRQVVLVRVAVTRRASKTSGVRRVLWTTATPQRVPYRDRPANP